MTTLTQNFQIIGGYDNRRKPSTIASADAHRMATRTPKPRAPKSHSIDEIRDRAIRMGVTFEMQGKTIYLTPNGCGEYYTTTKKAAWQVLDKISADIMATLTNDQVFDQAAAARELIFQ